MEEPGGLQSMGSQRVGHDWVTFHFHFHILSSWKRLPHFVQMYRCYLHGFPLNSSKFKSLLKDNFLNELLKATIHMLERTGPLHNTHKCVSLLLFLALFSHEYLTLVSVQFSRLVMFDSLWPYGLYVACQASLSISNSQSLPKPMSIESVIPSSHLILCCPLLLLPSILPNIRVLSNESALHIRWPKYWGFSFSISPFNEYSVLPRNIQSFRMDWLDLLAVQGTLKSLLQHQSSKALILQCSAFFIVQLSHPYMTTGKTIAL